MTRADAIALSSADIRVKYLEDVSLGRLVLEHYDRDSLPIRRYLAFLNVDPETAAEIVQESFLKLHQHLLSGGDRSNLRAWLYRVAHNLARNSRSAGRSRFNAPLPEPSLGEKEFADSSASAEEHMLRAERLASLRRALTMLSPAQRNCLVLRAQGLKYKEVADVLNLSVSTVGENVQRGLQKLKELI